MEKMGCCTHCQEIKPYKLCGNCNYTIYCSSECQRADWRVHKDNCATAGLFKLLGGKKCGESDSLSRKHKLYYEHKTTPNELAFFDFLNLKEINENRWENFFFRTTPGFFYFEGTESKYLQCREHPNLSCPGGHKGISYSVHIFYDQSNYSACPLNPNLIQDLLKSSRECNDVCFILKLNLTNGKAIVRYRKLTREFVKEIPNIFAQKSSWQ